MESLCKLTRSQKLGKWMQNNQEFKASPLLHREFRISLGYMKLYLRKLKPTSQDLLFPNILHLFTY